jgi:hypothetical protein
VLWEEVGYLELTEDGEISGELVGRYCAWRRGKVQIQPVHEVAGGEVLGETIIVLAHSNSSCWWMLLCGVSAGGGAL